jgi:Niemann-Pick C1 protein
VKALVLVVFAGVTGVLLWAALTREGYDFHVADLTPSDSAANQYINTFKRLFRGLEFPDNSMNLYFTNVNYSDATVQMQMSSLVTEATALSCIQGSTAPVDWHAAMTAWGKSTPAYNTYPMDPTGTFFVGDSGFYGVLSAFLSQPAFHYAYSGSLALDNGKISMSYVTFTLEFLSSAPEQVDALISLRNLAGASPLSANAFFTNGNEAFWEQKGFMQEEATHLFSMTLVAVAIVCAIFLVHPVAIFVQLLTLGMVFIDLLGALALASIDINSISVTNMIMAIGLVVDATVHIVRTFGVQDPKLSRDQRVTRTLGELGTPILLGAITIILGVIPLGAASSQVFRVFFKCFAFIVLIGWAHGLIFVPVLLSFIGPVTFRNLEANSAFIDSSEALAPSDSPSKPSQP